LRCCVPCGSSAPPRPALEGLARSLEPVELAAGEVLIREGEPGDRFHAVATASSRSRSAVASRHQRPRRWTGRIALLHGVPRTATVTATSPTTVFALNRVTFLAAVSGHTPPGDRPASQGLWLPADREAEVLAGAGRLRGVELSGQMHGPLNSITPPVDRGLATRCSSFARGDLRVTRRNLSTITDNQASIAGSTGAAGSWS
jgi:Cyclic nucleotide-binding domain